MPYKVLAVVGPTAVGKSSVAVDLAQQFNGVIINGDSVQVYKELNIGSAKITPEEMRGVEHLLLDCKELEEDYSVQHFQKEAREAIEEISEEGKLPIICGGTGLYVKALLYDYDFKETTEELNEYPDLTNEELYEKLQEVDPVTAQKLHPNNRRRLIRALQLADNGIIKSEEEAKQKHEAVYDCYLVGLTMDRARLKNRINERVDKMFDMGLVEEVQQLHDRYDFSLKSLQGIGYKEFVPYFNQEKTLEEVKSDIKTHTRQFAKRQYTWWNNQLPVHWYDIEAENFEENIINDVKEWLNGVE